MASDGSLFITQCSQTLSFIAMALWVGSLHNCLCLFSASSSTSSTLAIPSTACQFLQGSCVPLCSTNIAGLNFTHVHCFFRFCLIVLLITSDLIFKKLGHTGRLVLFACTCSSGIVWEGIQSYIDGKLKYQRKYIYISNGSACTTHGQNRQSLQRVL